MNHQNSQFPDTRGSLLLQLNSVEEEAAWREFVDIYRPVIYRIARRRGLQDADAQDLAQRVLMSVAGAIEEWTTRSHSVRFRHWLRRVTRNAILNAITRRPIDEAQGGSIARDLLAVQPTTNVEFDRNVEIEHRRELFRRAAIKIKSEVSEATWQSFQLSVIENLPIEQVAAKVGKSVGAAYACRGRVMNRISRSVRQMLEREE